MPQQSNLNNFKGTVYVVREQRYWKANAEEIEQVASFEVVGENALITGLKKRA